MKPQYEDEDQYFGRPICLPQLLTYRPLSNLLANVAGRLATSDLFAIIVIK